MYIKKVHINNIRSINDFEMEFDQPAGWHVIIGENGVGKSTIVRAISLALVGPEQAMGLRISWNEWLNNQSDEGLIYLSIESDKLDQHSGSGAKLKNQEIPNVLYFQRTDNSIRFTSNQNFTKHGIKNLGLNPNRFNWGSGTGWFSVAFGPQRRFTGGNQEWTKVFYSQPKLGAHLSVFGEDIALTEAIEWLVKLNYQVLENKENGNVINFLKLLINSEGFLPHQAKLESISSDGIVFRDRNKQLINVNQLSDGYRSILSLTFELIRQMVRVYGINEVFRSIEKGEHHIPVPGVVLIDEIDAHLHPTWQTSIGQWFTKYFPRIQFIVTTHSPLICRAAENGSIWQLAAPGSNLQSGQITGLEKDKLVFGNILEAYGTEAFGASPVRSAKSHEKLERLGELNMLSALGKIDAKQEQERLSLQKTLSTDDPTGF